MTNNLLWLGGPRAIMAARDQNLRLTNNTWDALFTPLLCPPLDEAPARPVTVVAEGNVFVNFPFARPGRAWHALGKGHAHR
jgi:hypothetical protein